MLHRLDNLLQFLHTFGGLTVEIHVAAKVYLIDFVDTLNHECLARSLPHQSVHLGVTTLTVNHNLRLVGFVVVSVLDALLKFEHHRASGINDFYIVASGYFVGFGRFAMRTKQHIHIVEFLQLLMGDGLQPLLLEAFHLVAIVHNVAQAVEVACVCQLLLCHIDGARHAKAESRILVNFDNSHIIFSSHRSHGSHRFKKV